MAEDAARRLTEIAARFEPKLKKALGEAFEALRASVPAAEVERALLRGGPGGVMALLDRAEGAFGGVRDRLEEAAAESGRAWISTVPAGAVLDPAFRFSIVNPETARFVEDYTLNLIRNISEDTREAVRRGLMSDVASGRNPRETARTFRSNLGLTPRQEQAVRNYHRALEDGGTSSLTRALRDRRGDAAVLRAARTGEALPADRVDRLVDAYRRKMLRHRSEVIARTESLRAATIGQRAAVRQALAQRAVDDSRLRRFWVKTNDSRIRDAHRAIPGMNPDGVGLDEPYQTPLGPLMYPRDPNGSGANTIQCRCAERYALADAAAPRPGMRPKAPVKPGMRPKAPVKPGMRPKAPVKPKTPAELKAEYERLRAEAESGKLHELATRQKEASKARVAWAKTLSPEELRTEKAKVFREMVKAPYAIDITTAEWEERIRHASGWVPMDVLEDMRRQGYRMNVRKLKALTPSNKKGFRSFAKNKQSWVAMDTKADVMAHEFGHQVDAFFSGGSVSRGRWTNRDFVHAKEAGGYKGIFGRLRGNTRGTYDNGDGQFWRDNWLNNYEGRIYKYAGGEVDGLEFWAMNCQRYSTYRHALVEGYDAAVERAKAAAAEAAKGGAADLARAELRGLENEGREAWARRVSSWGAVEKRYPEMADLINHFFGSDFVR
jgi:hypothetical protein